MFRWALAFGFVVTTGATAYLARANQRLERELASQSARPPTDECAATSSFSARANASAARPPAVTRLGRRLAVAVARRPSLAPRPDSEPDRSTGERWSEVREEIDAVFSRDRDESVDDYRDRVAPMVELALSGPRRRVSDRRAELEARANVTPEQRAEMDAAIEDAYSEALALANRAIQTGEIDPAKLEWNNVLMLGGGLGAIAGSTESRLGEILTPEQQQLFAAEGFRWAEYLGVNAPWEALDPPPLPGERATQVEVDGAR